MAGMAKGTADWAAQLGTVCVTHIQGEQYSQLRVTTLMENGSDMKFVPLLSVHA